MLVVFLALVLALAISLPALAGQVEEKLERNASASAIGFGVRAAGLTIPAEYTTKNGRTFSLNWAEPLQEKGIKYYWVIYSAEK